MGFEEGFSLALRLVQLCLAQVDVEDEVGDEVVEDGAVGFLAGVGEAEGVEA